MRVFNPDGSEAEKSGNGLRIFSRYLFDGGLVGNEEFTIETAGGLVKSKVLETGMIRVELGSATFQSDKIPIAGPPREVMNETIEVGRSTFRFCAASIGNPHCILLLPDISAEIAKTFGPLIEVHPISPSELTCNS